MAVYDDPVYLQDSSNSFQEPESVEYIPELDLALEDEELAQYIDEKIGLSKAYFNEELNLYARQKKLVEYYLGKQIDYEMFEEWQVPYINNVIFRNIETLIPIALDRIPDIVTLAASDNEESKKFAMNIRKVLERKIKGKEFRTVLKRSILHLLLEFYGVIKYRWDENLGKSGDIVFENVLPENIVFDHTATTVDEMDFIAEKIEKSVRELISMFPKAKNKILEATHLSGDNERMMMSKIKLWEVHFKIFDKKGEHVEAVCYKYKDYIFHKQKTPNWDYKGTSVGNGFLDAGKDIFDVQSEQTPLYYNHFEKPTKSYIFLNFWNLGRSVVDDTNAVEQTIPIQDVINKRGRQVTELADKANGKWVVSSAAMSQEEASLISDAPDEALWLNNPNNLPINNLASRTSGNPPAPILYQDQQFNKQSADDLLSTHASSRGTKETDVATTTLSLQRSDQTRIQDITKETIDKVVDEAANAMLQLIKVNATDEYMTKILGEDGQTTFIRLTRDMIQDGMEIMVKSSLVDQQERRAMAQEEARLQFTDPITYYEDMDRANPRERARRLVLWKQNRLDEYLNEGSMDQNKAIKDLFMLMNGQPLTEAPPMSKGYFAGVKAFVASPMFQQAPPQQQQPVLQLLQQLSGMEQKQQGTTQPEQPRQQQRQLSRRVEGRQVPSPEMFTGGREATQTVGA